MNRHPVRFRCTASVGALFTPALTAAQGRLPTMQDPSRGAGSGIVQTIQNYIEVIKQSLHRRSKLSTVNSPGRTSARGATGM